MGKRNRVGSQMEIGYTAEQESMRSELRAYYDRLLTDETVTALSEAHGIGPVPLCFLTSGSVRTASQQ